MQLATEEEKRPKLIKLAATGAAVFIHPCCICGSDLGFFGYDCTLTKKIRKLGMWYCHKPCKPLVEKTVEQIKLI